MSRANRPNPEGTELSSTGDESRPQLSEASAEERDPDDDMTVAEAIKAGLLKPVAVPTVAIKPLAADLHRLLTTPVIKIPALDVGAVNKALTNWLLPLQESFNQVGQLFQRIHAEVAPVVQALRPVLQAIASIDWDAWWQSRREGFLAAAKDGWFIQPEMPPRLVSLTESGELPDGFERTFVAELTTELDAIEARLVASYPKRATIVREAFALHREGRYLAAMPLLLNTAEGLVHDATHLSPFNTFSGVPQVSAWAPDLPLERIDSMLADALAVKHPLSQYTEGSRHSINHGSSVDYGTELASLKAISFLGFAGWLFCPIEGPLAKAAEAAGWVQTPRGLKPPKKA